MCIPALRWAVHLLRPEMCPHMPAWLLTARVQLFFCSNNCYLVQDAAETNLEV